MNNKRAYYYPIPLYLLLLLMVWVGSFFVDVAQMLSDSAHSPSSLISAEGIRWAVRNALPTINAIPWGVVMLSIAIYGLLRGSGITRTLCRLVRFRRISGAELRAFSFSFAALVCYLTILYMSSSSPWKLLGGVTDEPALSPIVQGHVILLFIGVLFMSLIYGFIYGNYRSLMDIFTSMADSFKFFVPALMALIPASGIVPCLQYVGVQPLFGIPWKAVETMLFLLPFIYAGVLQLFDKEKH
ncbi:MAG: AbgT family transporter [Bacteroidaceae bacterium]|jgi:p-aminobenzoyl-glutamate transporter AbgT|nr:AbgT family transporter [Bacteroidaceae bacterium]